MIKEIELPILPYEYEQDQVIKQAASQYLKIPIQEISAIQILKRSIDARSRKVVYRIRMLVYINEAPTPAVFHYFQSKQVQNSKVGYIIGSGPAGLFAALRLIELGIKPILFERGKDVKTRRRDLALLNREGIVDSESNYCFGEGGAGTYSDGKLYTRSTKRGEVDRILHRLIEFGADPDIAINTRPHIGTNKLPQIIEKIRLIIEQCGGEIHFNSKLEDIEIQHKQISRFKINNEWYSSNHLILATGHSAHDVYELLHKRKIRIDPKAFALGVRIEHPQELIDRSQYHCDVRPEYLPASYYSLVEQVDARGVFSFCMCPGGIIAPCATKPGEVVVNGWSPSKRNNAFANSGLVVQIDLKDIPNAEDALSALKFQQSVEQKAYVYANNSIKAPAQRIADFVDGKISNDLPANSYIPGLSSVDLTQVLPSMVSERLKKALPIFGKKIKGYCSNEGVLVGVESRTSSAIRIPRDPINLQHLEVEGLFPCAEGSGYAGGIVSAAIDGEKIAEALQSFLNN